MNTATNTDLVDAEWNQVAWGNYESNLEFLRRAGLPSTMTRVLEIGCGKGAILRSLQKAGHIVTGIDVDADALAYCRTPDANLAVSVASGDTLPFSRESFDAVLSFDVFEHIRDTDRHLKEVRRVLRPGGWYLLQTPNKWTNIPFELLRQWKKFHTGPLTSYRELTKDHCALHSYWQMKERFSRNGFDLSFFDIPVVNQYFRSKMRSYLGPPGEWILEVLNPDRFPMYLRTNFYAKACVGTYLPPYLTRGSYDVRKSAPSPRQNLRLIHKIRQNLISVRNDPETTKMSIWDCHIAACTWRPL